MSRQDPDALKGILQSLEHMLNTLDVVSSAATQLINAQRSGTPLSPKMLDHYSRQFERRTEQRTMFRDVIARWWTMLEETQH
jgi:hypothetical protein